VAVSLLVNAYLVFFLPCAIIWVRNPKTIIGGTFRMKRLFASLLLILILLIGGWNCRRFHETTPVDPDRMLSDEGPVLGVDLARKPLERIPVGTVIDKTPSLGWSHLVLLAIPTLAVEDDRDAPKIAAYYAQMFKFTLLAKVSREEARGKGLFYLQRVARGFATTIDGKETIVSSQNTLGADLGLFGRKSLAENEKILDNDVQQVLRTPTMLMFDAKSVMLFEGNHVPRIMRHAILVDPASGQLHTLIWLLTDDYKPALEGLQWIPNGMREQRWLSVKRDKFSLGIPTRDAFALRQIPQGTPVPYTPELSAAATVRTFTEAEVPAIEATLRAAAVKAAGK
jgi:hypothetical protein